MRNDFIRRLCLCRSKRTIPVCLDKLPRFFREFASWPLPAPGNQIPGETPFKRREAAHIDRRSKVGFATDHRVRRSYLPVVAALRTWRTLTIAQRGSGGGNEFQYWRGGHGGRTGHYWCSAQPAANEIEAHLAAAKAAAGFDFTGTLGAHLRRAADRPGRDVAPGPAPDRATWFTEPAKVFDNLYFVGTKFHSSWALTTSEGIILIDTLYEYASDEAIVGGLRKLGLDPATVKYVIISHAHGDHVGGAKLMQDRFGSRIVMGAPDWDVIEKSVNQYPNGKPKRDIVATDGQKITLGDTSVTLVLTPGHTPGTVSMLFEVKDNGTAAHGGLFGRHRVQLPQRRAALRHLHQLPAQDGGARRRRERYRADVEPLRIRQCRHQDQDAAPRASPASRIRSTSDGSGGALFQGHRTNAPRWRGSS